MSAGLEIFFEQKTNYQIFSKLNDECNFDQMKLLLSRHIGSFEKEIERA